MKTKRGKYVLIVMSGIVLIYILWKSFPLALEHIMGFDYMTSEELIKLYQENQEVFNEVAERLSDYPDGIRVESSIMMKFGIYGSGRSDWQSYRGKGFLLSDTERKGLEQNQIQNMNNIPIYKLYRKARIFRITKENGRIYFTQASNLGFSVGIAYSIDEDSDMADSTNYITEWEKIQTNWYYFKNE